MGFISKDPKFDSLAVSNAQYAKYGTVKTASYTVTANDYIVPVDSTTAGASALAANYNVTTNAGHDLTDTFSETRARGQAFAASSSGNLVSAVVKLSKDSVPTGAPLFAKLYAYPGIGVATPGTLLETSSNSVSDFSTLATDPSETTVTFNFAGTTPLVASTKYILAVQTAGITAGGQVFIRYDSGYTPAPESYRLRAPSAGGFWDVTTAAGSIYLVVNVATPPITVTLPAITSANKGQILHIKDVGGQAGVVGKDITVTPGGGNTIDADSSFVINSPYQNVTLVSDGVSAWRLL